MRTGVALSDLEGVIATPLEVVPSLRLSEYLRRLVREEDISEVGVGVPVTLDGEVGFQARKVLDSLAALRRELPEVRFVEWDERLTTRLAAAQVQSSGRRRRGRNARVDHLAAARMLQEYLGSRGGF